MPHSLYVYSDTDGGGEFKCWMLSTHWKFYFYPVRLKELEKSCVIRIGDLIQQSIFGSGWLLCVCVHKDKLLGLFLEVDFIWKHWNFVFTSSFPNSCPCKLCRPAFDCWAFDYEKPNHVWIAGTEPPSWRRRLLHQPRRPLFGFPQTMWYNLNQPVMLVGYTWVRKSKRLFYSFIYSITETASFIWKADYIPN